MTARGVQAARLRYRLGPFGGQCRACRADVLWLRDGVGGPKVAVDARPVPDGPVAVDLGAGRLTHWLVAGELPGDDGAFVPHALTCLYRPAIRADRPAVARSAQPAVCGLACADLFTAVELACTLPPNHRSSPCKP